LKKCSELLRMAHFPKPLSGTNAESRAIKALRALAEEVPRTERSSYLSRSSQFKSPQLEQFYSFHDAASETGLIAFRWKREDFLVIPFSLDSNPPVRKHRRVVVPQ